MAGEGLREPGEIGDATVRDDQLRIRIALDQAREMVGDRRQPPPPVNQDRNAPLRRESEDRIEPLVVQEKSLRPRVQLDSPCSPVETADRLDDGLLCEVEADERDQQTVRAGSGLERAVVGGTERRVTIGLVEAEAERPRHAGRAEERLELLAATGEAVDVGAAVHVRVEELEVRRNARGELAIVGAHQILGALEQGRDHPADDSERPFRSGVS